MGLPCRFPIYFVDVPSQPPVIAVAGKLDSGAVGEMGDSAKTKLIQLVG